MPFIKVKRVNYKNNPLDNVICQVRFPPILRIDTEAPAVFQEKVQAIYGNLSEKQELAFDFQLGNQAKEGFKQIISPSIINYEFISEDSIWKLNLTRNFLSLSTKEYHNWKEFKERFEFALTILNDVYKPMLFTRVGLRYIDVIVRSKLKLDKVEWSELIENHLLGIMASDLKNEIERSEAAFEIALKDKESLVRVITKSVKAEETGESCFMIDSDYFTNKKVKMDAVLPLLESFHEGAFRLFRWCVTEKLHNAMEPRKI